MNINYQQYTDTGDQNINQDYYAYKITDNWALFMTADGLGGHQAGEKIAKVFCETMLALAVDFASELQAQNSKATILSWYNQALEKIAIDYAEDLAMQDAHTTFAMLWLDNSQTLTAHIGDTRIYRIIENSISRTRDHSVTQMLLDEGDISELEMGSHPDQNRLTRSVCLANIHQPTIKIHPVAHKNDRFILCSDGLWSNTSQQELLNLAQLTVTEADLMALAKIAIKRAKGNSDNVTLQWLKIK